MKLRQLVYFNEVVRHAFNISNAAHSLYTSQSGVSRQLQELSEELGVELFEHRGKRLVGLTPIGEDIAEVVRDVIRDTNQIKKLAEAQRDGHRGELAIVASRHAAASNLHEAIARCRSELPALQIRIEHEEPTAAIAMLLKGDADLGLLSEPREHFPELLYFPLAQWRMLLLAPLGHPIGQAEAVTLEEIARYPCCSFERSAQSRQIVDRAFESAGLKSPVVFSLDSNARILEYVEQGIGLGFVSEASFNPLYHPKLQTVDVGRLFRPLTSGLLIPRRSRVPKAVSAFVRILAPSLDLQWSDGCLVPQ